MGIKRIRCQSGIYHVVMRGVNRQIIFDTDDDCRRFLTTLKTNAENSKMEIYAWCLMGNHIHLLVREGEETISDTMRRIEVSYVKYFNTKNERVGPLFQGRFRSKPVENEKAFWRVYNYIALNPVKAGLAQSPETYMWSWLSSVKTEQVPVRKVSFEHNETVPLGMISGAGETRGVPEITDDFTEDEIDDFEMERSYVKKGGKRPVSDSEAMKKMGKLTGLASASEVQKLGIRDRDAFVKTLLEARLSPTQISRLTGINRTQVYRIEKRM